MNSLRKISPLVSFVLTILMVAGSSGYTFIIHSCHKCQIQEVISSTELAAKGSGCSCKIYEPVTEQEENGFVFSHDCCSIQIEKLMTSDLVKADVQAWVMSFFPLTTFISIIPQESKTEKICAAPSFNIRDGRDLTRLHCQILS